MTSTSNTPDWLNLDDIDDEELVEAPDPTDADQPDPAPQEPEATESAAPEAEASEDVKDDATEASDTPAAEAAPETIAPPDPTPEPEPEPEPLVIKASRKAVTIDGVKRQKNGLLITPDSEKRVTDLLRRGLDAESVLVPENTQLRKALAQAEQATSAREKEFEAMVSQLDAILDGGPDAVVAFLEDYARQRPVLKAKAIEAAAHWKLEQAQRASQPDPEEYLDSIAQEARDVIGDRVRTKAQEAGLDKADADALVQRYANRLGAFVVQVPHDMPELGLRAGQYAVNEQALLDELGYDVGLRVDALTAKRKAETLTKQQQAAKLAADAKAKNAAVMANATKTAAKPNPKVGESAQRGKPKTKQDWLADVLADDDDD